MEHKTKVNAEDGKQELFITREFDLPLETLFEAYIDPEIIEHWMGTKVIKLESRRHGSYQIETSHGGNVMFLASGVIHEFIPNKKITRTFEMENTLFGVQFEFYEFEKITDEKSKLNMKVIYESVSHRAEVLKLPFASGINMAHNRIQTFVKI